MNLYLSDEEAYEIQQILDAPNFKLSREQRDLAEQFSSLIYDKLQEKNLWNQQNNKKEKRKYILGL